LRLRPFVHPHRWTLIGGIVAFGLARICEGVVPFALAIAIDRIAAGSADIAGPVGVIAVAVAARFVIVAYAR
jgi:hypothetical protein